MRTWRAVAGVLQAQRCASDRIGRFALMIRSAPIDVLFGTAQPLSARPTTAVQRSAARCTLLPSRAMLACVCVAKRACVRAQASVRRTKAPEL